jgi:hypothetical protein
MMQDVYTGVFSWETKNFGVSHRMFHEMSKEFSDTN